MSVLSVKENGKYYIIGATDLPDGVFAEGYLEVTNYEDTATTWTIQYTPTNGVKKYVNTCLNDTWKGWDSYALNSDLPKFNAVSKGHNFTSSESFVYTGLSFDIPANSFYNLTAVAFYNINQVVSIGLSTSNSSFISGFLSSNDVGQTYGSTSRSGYTDSAITVYVWAKYAGVGTNTVALYGYYVN